MLLALTREAGCEAVDLGIARDDEAGITATLEDAAARFDAVLTSGGVSVGDYDYVKAALARLGTLVARQVAIKPAKPLAFGVVAGTPVFGLPGNPVSSLVSFECFARPALLTRLGHPHRFRPEVTALAEHPYRTPARRPAASRPGPSPQHPGRVPGGAHRRAGEQRPDRHRGGQRAGPAPGRGRSAGRRAAAGPAPGRGARPLSGRAGAMEGVGLRPAPRKAGAAPSGRSARPAPGRHRCPGRDPDRHRRRRVDPTVAERARIAPDHDVAPHRRPRGVTRRGVGRARDRHRAPHEARAPGQAHDGQPQPTIRVPRPSSHTPGPLVQQTATAGPLSGAGFAWLPAGPCDQFPGQRIDASPRGGSVVLPLPRLVAGRAP